MPNHNLPPSHSSNYDPAHEPDRVDLTTDESGPETVGSPAVTFQSSPAMLNVGRHHLLDEIARGGMGAIWRATDTTLNREVAVKVLMGKFTPDSGTARRFADEARITGQLQHPAMLVPTTGFAYDFGILPISQQMWYNHLMTFKDLTPLQAPETFNLEMVMKAVQAAGHTSN